MAGSQGISDHSTHEARLLAAKAMARVGGVMVAFKVAAVEVAFKVKAAASRILLSARIFADLGFSADKTKALAAAVALTLAGCAPALGSRPEGVSGAQWNAVTVECNREGAAVPVLPVPVVIAGSSFRSESCGKHGCTDYSTFTPPSVQMQDANAPAREQVMRSCFSRNTPDGLKP